MDKEKMGKNKTKMAHLAHAITVVVGILCLWQSLHTGFLLGVMSGIFCIMYGFKEANNE